MRVLERASRHLEGRPEEQLEGTAPPQPGTGQGASSHSVSLGPAPERRVPDRWPAAVFGAKVAALRLRRGVLDLAAGPRRLRRSRRLDGLVVVGASRTPLWSDGHPGEQRLQLGKVQNLRVAARALDGVVVPAGAVFSFWRQLGRASRARGYVPGRMLQQGCMVPAVGGGLCQLSNALYDAALQAGCAIVERHAHSRVVPGSAAAQGRDGTVAWNYVDLRFRPGRTMQLLVRVERDELVLELAAPGDEAASSVPVGTVAAPSASGAPARSCASCAETTCFRHERRPHDVTGRTAFLLDEAWPEFLAYVAATRDAESVVGLPLPWRARRRSAGLGPARGAVPAALERSLRVRLAAPGAATRRAEIEGTARVARGLARLLTPDVTALCVAQSLLPTLWRDGHLGGRRVSVVMTRLPMHLLHDRLDAAFAAHPDRATLADFRAPPELLEWEAEALARAETVVTPHAELAALFPDRATKLDWHLPAPPPELPAAVQAPPRWRVAFPGPTLARKGAYEMREAARTLDLEVLLLGAELEGPDFWDGVRTIRPAPDAGPLAWLRDVDAVVQPALVEEQPRRLLAALAVGVPVVATPACGLDAATVPVQPDNPTGLVRALREVLQPTGHGTVCLRPSRCDTLPSDLVERP